MSRKVFLTSNLAGSILLLVLTDPSTRFLHRDLLSPYESFLLAPIFILMVSTVISAIALFFFNEKIFLLWLRKFFFWFVLISVLAIYSIGGGGGMLSPSHSDVALLLGQVMVGATLIFALTARFYFKIK